MQPSTPAAKNNGKTSSSRHNRGSGGRRDRSLSALSHEPEVAGPVPATTPPEAEIVTSEAEDSSFFSSHEGDEMHGHVGDDSSVSSAPVPKYRPRRTSHGGGDGIGGLPTLVASPHLVPPPPPLPPPTFESIMNALNSIGNVIQTLRFAQVCAKIEEVKKD